jgi:hypothetical protein
MSETGKRRPGRAAFFHGRNAQAFVANTDNIIRRRRKIDQATPWQSRAVLRLIDPTPEA